jgi:hypothetical protein
LLQLGYSYYCGYTTPLASSKAHWGKRLSNSLINWVVLIANQQRHLKKEKLQETTHIERKQGNYTQKTTKRNLKNKLQHKLKENKAPN